MATAVIMPKQGQSVETCIITKWFRERGEVIRIGDILFSYETDKAAFDMESPVEGILLEIFYEEGSEVPVLANVAVIGLAGEETDSFRTGGSAGKKVQPVPAISKDESYLTNDANSDTPLKGEAKLKPRISPRAKRLAQEKGINFTLLSGSGPGGRIIVNDIENAIKGKAIIRSDSYQIQDSEYHDQPLSNVRKLIAKAMHASLANSAQLTHHMSADARNILEARKKIKNDLANGSARQDITINDMVCWCLIKAVKKFPEANSHLLDDKLRIFNKVHLGIAVHTPRGLMVPAIRNADEKDLGKLSEELKSAAEACRKGNVSPELLQSNAASITVSNLGNFGVEMFTPVINLPQVCILGICTITHRPADLGNNTFGFIPAIGLSLTYDHRAIDGGPATMFLKEIKNQIEGFKY